MASGTGNFLREFWGTLCAVGTIIRQFFIRYFLPLHTEDTEPVANDWDADDDIPKKAATLEPGLPETAAAPIVAVMPDAGPSVPTEAPAPVAPVIAPPIGAAERVSRETFTRTPDNPWGDLEEEAVEENAEPPSASDSPENPFLRERDGEPS